MIYTCPVQIHTAGRCADWLRSPGRWRTFLLPEFTEGALERRGRRVGVHWQPGAGLPSEVLLPPLLGLNGIQDGLPLRLVLLPDLLNLLLHHGVQSQEPLLKVFHRPTLQLRERQTAQSRQGPGQWLLETT